jgi:hypothetical protein
MPVVNTHTNQSTKVAAIDITAESLINKNQLIRARGGFRDVFLGRGESYSVPLMIED